MSNPCYSAGVNHIPDSSAAPLQLVSVEVPTALAAGAVNSSAVDRSGLNAAVLLVQLGVTSGTPDSFSLNAKLQSSDKSDGSFTDVPGGAITALTAASTSGRVSLSLAGAKQFVRVVLTAAFVNGTTPKITTAATLLLSP